jgi:hypothetical protein
MTTPEPEPEPVEDQRLLQDLRAAVRSAGAPTPGMMAAAEAAYSRRTVDGELAALTYDSLTDTSVLLRGGLAGPRTLVFESNSMSVHVEQTEEGMVGQLVPPTDGEVTLQGPQGELGHASVDELGCFCFDRTPHGTVRLQCRTSSGAVVTHWVRL